MPAPRRAAGVDPTFPPAGVDAESWFASAEKVPGSWWPRWYAWLARHGGSEVKARTKPGNAEFTPVEPAPGSYVEATAWAAVPLGRKPGARLPIRTTMDRGPQGGPP